MKAGLQNTDKKRHCGLRPAAVVEYFILGVVLLWLLLEKFGTWLLNTLRGWFGQ